MIRKEGAAGSNVSSNSFMAYLAPKFNLPVDLSFGAGVFVKPETHVSDEGGVIPSFAVGVTF